CELCGAALADEHRHVVEQGRPGVLCACRACGILFERGDAVARYRTVPERVRRAGELALTADRWAELGIPVALAICYRDTARGGIVCYPGPAGVIEAELAPEAWEALAAATPLARDLADDVEALLVRGARGERALACYLVPISAGYELVARLRAVWEGFSGGERAEAELARFFADLDRRGQPGRGCP
ncbi:MAG: hypothetical protein KIT31_42585, partial [Deltaproteobacteria bacterium]|nr:hypothetical protein [Deltaproteobacteria bacterium]